MDNSDELYVPPGEEASEARGLFSRVLNNSLLAKRLKQGVYTTHLTLMVIGGALGLTSAVQAGENEDQDKKPKITSHQPGADTLNALPGGNGPDPETSRTVTTDSGESFTFTDVPDGVDAKSLQLLATTVGEHSSTPDGASVSYEKAAAFHNYMADQVEQREKELNVTGQGRQIARDKAALLESGIRGLLAVDLTDERQFRYSGNQIFLDVSPSLITNNNFPPQGMQKIGVSERGDGVGGGAPVAGNSELESRIAQAFAEDGLSKEKFDQIAKAAKAAMEMIEGGKDPQKAAQESGLSARMSGNLYPIYDEVDISPHSSEYDNGESLKQFIDALKSAIKSKLQEPQGKAVPAPNRAFSFVDELPRVPDYGAKNMDRGDKLPAPSSGGNGQKSGNIEIT